MIFFTHYYCSHARTHHKCQFGWDLCQLKSKTCCKYSIHILISIENQPTLSNSQTKLLSRGAHVSWGAGRHSHFLLYCIITIFMYGFIPEIYGNCCWRNGRMISCDSIHWIGIICMENKSPCKPSDWKKKQ